MGSFSIWHWLIVLVIVALLFGTSKLRNIGGDLGAAVKSFKKGMAEDESQATEKLEKPEGETRAQAAERSDSEAR